MLQVKFLKKHGSFGVGAVGECEDDYANELISKGLAVLYDAEAERQAEEAQEKMISDIVEKAADAVTGKLREAATDPKVKGVFQIRERSDDAPAGGFKSLGDFALTVKDWSGGHRDDKRMLAWMTKAAETGQSEALDSEGGFLVPEEFSADVLRKTYANAALASRARQVPLSTKAVKIPYIRETSRADGSRQGGIRAYWANELAGLTASKATFGAARLEVEKLYCYIGASEELLEDATAVGSIIAAAAADELAFKIDDAIINGTGAGMPMGLLNAPCTTSKAKETGQAAATVVAENIFGMWSRMWGPSRANAIWIINQDIEPQLFGMSLAVGTGGMPVYMPANGVAGTPYSTLMGRPVVPCESCPTLGTVGDIILADMSQYLFAQHVSGVNAQTSMHIKFDYDQTVFRFVVRVDGQPWWPDKLTPKSGSTNYLSPFVTLATRA